MANRYLTSGRLLRLWTYPTVAQYERIHDVLTGDLAEAQRDLRFAQIMTRTSQPDLVERAKRDVARHEATIASLERTAAQCREGIAYRKSQTWKLA